MRETKPYKLFFLSLFLLMALWGMLRAPSVSAHEGHKHKNAPASAKKLKKH